MQRLLLFPEGGLEIIDSQTGDATHFESQESISSTVLSLGRGKNVQVLDQADRAHEEAMTGYWREIWKRGELRACSSSSVRVTYLFASVEHSLSIVTKRHSCCRFSLQEGILPGQRHINQIFDDHILQKAIFSRNARDVRWCGVWCGVFFTHRWLNWVKSYNITPLFFWWKIEQHDDIQFPNKFTKISIETLEIRA